MNPPRNPRRFLSWICLAFAPWTSHAAPAAASDFLSVVQTYAQTMIDRGRDVYGPQPSPLFLSALDRMSLQPLIVRPAPPAGIRRGDRPGRPWSAMTGANPQLDQNLLRVCYVLSDLTGDPQFAKAADEELVWFLTHAQSPATGLLAWGEHLCWDVVLDEPISGGTEPVHEFARPWVLWDRCFALAPEPSRKFAIGLWEHQIANHKTGGFDRHAPFFEHGPQDGKDFARHGAFYIGTWSQAWKHTRDDTFLEAIQVILDRFERKRVQPDGSKVATLGPLDLEAAAPLVPEPLAGRLKRFAAEEDQLILPSLRQQIDHRSLPMWENGYSAGTLADLAMFCLARHEQTQEAAYRECLLKMADAYLESRPEEDLDAWPMSFAHVISLQVAAHRMTRRATYLEAARRFAHQAVTLFWQDQPLPRASLQTSHYETITGCDSLALALLQVHAAAAGRDTSIPSNTIDR